jgi:hypothetical protein
VSEIDDLAPEQLRVARQEIGKDVVGRHPASPSQERMIAWADHGGRVYM